MKQESTKKTPKWLLPVIIGAAVLVIAGILLAIFLLPQNTGSETVQSKLYWNVDRLANLEEETNMSIRPKGADGLYTIRFAVDGEQVEYKCADKRLVNQIDFLDVMGLVFDADGLIIGALDPTQVAVEVARDFFVKSFDGNTITVNSSQAMNGMAMDITVTADTGVYDVAPTAAVVGQKTTELNLLDKVTVYANAEGENTHVFVTARAKTAGAYYRVDRFYDSNLASTTREPDADGAYSILFAHNGEQVTLKCKDVNLVSNIDAGTDSRVQMGLVLDEEGYIVEKISISEALKGKLLYSMYDVTAVDGAMVTMESKWSGNRDKGEIKDLELPEDFKDIFLMETDCGAEFIGQRVDSLQPGDRVYVYSDFDNKPVLIYITRRACDYPFYYNISRSYSTKRQETTREPVNGWYIFEMAKEGGTLVTLKTKDKDLASEVDRYDPAFMGLKVENGIILDSCDPQCITGRSGLSNRYVTEMLGSIVRFATASDLTSGSNLMLSQDCKIYDVTGAYGVTHMTETELKMSDRVSILRNAANEVTTIFIWDRYEKGAKIYYNISRKYSSKLKETTREPDAEGYYVFDMTCEGKEVQVKTKSKKLATYIDKVAAKLIALRVSNGIVKSAYNRYYDCIEYGNKVMSGVYFDHIDADGKVHYYTVSNGVKTEGVSSYSVADDYVVYNNSAAYLKNRGEKAKLQKGDYIYTVTSRATQKILQIFIREREVDAPLYWKTEQKYNSTTKETTRQPDAEGYYVFDLVVNGEIKTFKTKSKDVASRVDAYSYAFTMITKGDIILAACDATNAKGVDTHLYRFTYVKEIKGNTVITYTTDTTSTNYGKDLELKFTKNSKVSDVCTYSDGFGKATTPGIGDRVVSYVDADKNVLYSFIDRKCTRAAGPTGLCEHCGEVVNWTPFVGTIDKKDMHYYLPNDRERSQRTIGYTAAELATDPSLVQYKTCFDLNGHTLTGTGSTPRNFWVNSELNLMDSAGGGKLISPDNATGIRLTFGGDAKVNIYGGTYEKAEGVGTVGSGALIYGGGCTINIYDGTFIGGKASLGGIANIGTNSTLNIEGGTFISGTADQGNSIYIKGGSDAPSTLAMKNCKIDGGVDPDGAVNIYLGSNVEIGNAKNAGLKLQPGKLVDVSKLDTTSSIYVNALGVFTTERDDIETVKDVFKGLDEYSKVETEGKALAMNVVVTADPETDTQKRVDKWVEKVKADGSFAAGGILPKSCPICNGEAVIWEVAAPGMTVAKTGGHYYFNSENGEIEYTAMNLLTTSYNGQKACVYLNDQNISEYGRLRIRSGEFNIFGDGTITKLDNDGSNKEMPVIDITTFDTSRTTLNIYGGNYVSNVLPANAPAGVPVIGISSMGAATSVNIYGGTFTMADGTVGSTLRSAVGGEFNLYGGTVNSGTTGAVSVQDTAVTIQDMTLEGVELNGQSALTLSGKVEIPATKGGLVLAEGVIADIAQLATDSAINVTATGIFTTERDDIDAVKDCFQPAEEIKLAGKALAYGEVAPPAPPAPELPAITDTTFTTDWAPNAEGYAYCEACYKQMIALGRSEENAKEYAWNEWTAYDESLADENGNLMGEEHSGKHYYLTANQTVTKKRFARVYNGVSICFNLNGFSITKSASAPAGSIFALDQDTGSGTPILYLMDSKGTGVVTGRGSGGNSSGSAISVDDYGVCKIFGGTYRRTADAAGQRTATVNPGGILEIYNGTIDGRLYDTTDVTVLAASQNASRAGMAILMEGTESKRATLELHGGTIYGGTLKDGATVEGGAAIQVGSGSNTYADFTMAGGVIYGGVNNDVINKTGLNTGGIAVQANATFTMTGGAISGGTALDAAAANLYIAGTASITDGNIAGGIYVAEGANLTLGGATGIDKPENGKGLTLAEGVVANIDALAAQAQIAVEGEAGKVISNVISNASAVKNCFTAGEGLDVIVGSTGALEIAVEGTEPEGPGTEDPELDPAAHVKTWHETYAAAFRAEGKLEADATVEAPCPFCSPDANVTWTAAKKFESTVAGAHLYMYEEYNASSTNFITTSGDGAARCVYLNGFNVTSDGLRIRGRRNLNLIAYGSTVTRTTKVDGSSRSEGFIQGEGDSFSIYGGNFVNNDPGIATIRITSINNVMNLFDATFTSVDNNVLVVTSSPATMGTTSIHNCTFTGCAGKDAIVLDKAGTVNISGSNTAINGGMSVAEGVTLNLSGKPAITGLTLNGAAVANVDGLKRGAQIAVAGEAGKVISNVSENVSVAQKCFTAGEGLEVVVSDGALVITQAVAPAQTVVENPVQEASKTVKN